MDTQGLKSIFKSQPLVTKAQAMQSVEALLEYVSQLLKNVAIHPCNVPANSTISQMSLFEQPGLM